MDLKIKDVAQLLNVPEATIEEWSEQKKIPAYTMNGQYRFNRDEIESWMMKQNEEGSSLFSQGEKLSLYDDKVKHAIQNAGMQKYCLYRAIHRGIVIDHLEAKNKEELIRSATKEIAKHLSLDEEIITEMLLDREKMMPTSLNHGIGIPHTRDFLLKEPFDVVSMVFLKKPIEYGALDGKPVDILFFLFSCEDKRHLQLLAKIAHIASSEEARDYLRSHPNKSELLEFIKKWEEKLAN